MSDCRPHDLKTWPDPFQAVLEGRKRFELRVNDRGFRTGDVLILREWDPACLLYSGRWIRALVTYMAEAPAWGLPAGMCIMSIRVEGPDYG